MYYTRTVGKRYVGIICNVISFFLGIVAVVKRYILLVFVILTFLYAYDFVVFKQRGNQSFREHVDFAVGFNLYVILVGIHTQSYVGRKRPRRCRPREEVTVIVLSLELDEYGFFLDVLISLSNFVRRKSRSASGAIRHDFVTFVDKSFVGNRLDSPPY